ncbi:zinc finger HIT domain-containing protein 2-like [Glandiceps talaboti]
MADNKNSDTSCGLLLADNGEQDRVTCKLCLKQFSKYTCPRCNIGYCSIACYKSEQHSSCSEQFYKECFMEALKEQRGSDEEKRKMLEMLKRVEDEHNDLDSDDEHVESIEERIAGLDLDRDTDALWEKLTAGEKKEFQSLIKEGNIENLVEVWEPWWNKQDKKLIEEFDFKEDPKEDLHQETECRCPAVLENIPKLTELLKSRKPADRVQFNLIEILFTYAYIVRLYNGSHFDLPLQSVQSILNISLVLSENQTHGSTVEAVHSAIHRINQEKSLTSSVSFTISTLVDVIKILTGPNKREPVLYVLAALSDLHRLLTSAKKVNEKEHKLTSNRSDRSEHGTMNMKTLLFHAKKKVVFLLSWCGCHGDLLKPLALEVHMEYVSMATEHDQQQQLQHKIEDTWGDTKPPRQVKKLIEEI